MHGWSGPCLFAVPREAEESDKDISSKGKTNHNNNKKKNGSKKKSSTKTSGLSKLTRQYISESSFRWVIPPSLPLSLSLSSLLLILSTIVIVRAPLCTVYHVLLALCSVRRTTWSLVLSFAREFLQGEGDVVKHLSSLGYSLSFEQSALDEFDFTVANLATDLRDGVRLCR